jgi:hypothetical protein
VTAIAHSVPAAPFERPAPEDETAYSSLPLSYSSSFFFLTSSRSCSAQELMKFLAGANQDDKPDYRTQALSDAEKGERFVSGDVYDLIILLFF